MTQPAINKAVSQLTWIHKSLFPPKIRLTTRFQAWKWAGEQKQSRNTKTQESREFIILLCTT